MKYRLRKLILPVATFLLTATVVSGCGTISASSGNATTSNSTASSGSAKSSNEKLVLYSAQGYDAAMAKAFQAKTGIKVQLVDDSTGNIVAKMEAEKSNPHWDVAWFDGAATMQGLDNEGMLLQNWTPQGASNYTSLGKSLVPSDQSYHPTGITAAAAIGYNTKLVSPADAPKDWNDLLKPQFKNAIAMNDPSISGPTFPYVAGMLQRLGTTQGEKFYTDLKANGLKVFPTNGDTLKALLSGKAKVVTIQDTALLKGKLSGDPIQIVYPPSGVSSMPTTISIDKNAPDMDAAKQFVEFVLSPEGQKIMLDPKQGGSDSYYNPVVGGVTADSARQQSGINWVPINAVTAAKNETEIKQWFNENITK